MLAGVDTDVDGDPGRVIDAARRVADGEVAASGAVADPFDGFGPCG